MTFSEKLMELRKSRGWSQEELGERLGVTRQTVSKWELGATTPEMEKLSALSELFGITTDELIKGSAAPAGEQTVIIHKKTPFVNGEYKSKRTWRGMPFVHITARGTAKGFIAIGVRSVGIISLGVMSVGAVSVGALSLGVIAIGFLAAGVFCNGMIAAGVFALGGAAAGLFAFGGVSAGWVSYGGVSTGCYSIGGLSNGRIALGGSAHGVIAVGGRTDGEICLPLPVSAEEFRQTVQSRLPNTPKFITDMLSWWAENAQTSIS